MKASIQPEKQKRGDDPGHLFVDPLLTPAEVAAITSLSIETLAQWRSQKRGILYVKISRNCVRYRQDHLHQWLLERRVRVDVDAP
jgi:hypothetical protein